MFNKFCVVLIFLLFIGFSVVLLGNESTSKYFPSTLESYWVYEDQDGNEFTRRAIEGEEIAGKTYSAFSYEPELEDWVDYSYFLHPSLYQVSDAGITLIVKDEVEKAVKARLKKEMDALVEALMATEVPPDTRINVDIDVQVQDLLFLLPDAIIADEKWDANQIEATVKITFIGDNVPDEHKLTIDFTIIETGIVLGTDSVETAAGTFEDCLKVEYRTETTAILDPVPPPPDQVDPPGETVTTVWFAPGVGIVKVHQKRNHSFLEMLSDEMLSNDEGIPLLLPPNPEPKTFELKKYEIKTADSENESN